MKKLIAFIAMGAIFLGIGITSVAADEYEIVKGDNLWNIALENDTTVEYLMEVNNLESTIIHPKQNIIIDHLYTVEKGDTVRSIAKEYDITVKDIREWNELDSYLLDVGQELEVYDIDLDPSEREALREMSEPEVAKASINANSNPEPKTKTKASTTQNKAPASTTEKKSQGKTISVEATAYTAECTGCSGITYTGVNLNNNRNAKVIAVDPNVIPLGTEVYVEGYGNAVAEDIGSAIKGNRIDIHVPTKKEAFSWGRRTVNVTILD